MALRSILISVGAALTLFAAEGPAQAARVALVVGNAAYEHTRPLTTPVADAYAFSDFLRAQDFVVTEVLDADRGEMATALEAFIGALSEDDTAVFYYAGHGLQAEGKNFLMGVDARLASSFDIAAEAIELQQVVSRMEARANTVMIFIDACRDNPLATRLPASTRGLTVGLAPVEAEGQGTMIAFAAAPGQLAEDGTGNSPFTAALIANLGTPELEVGTAFKRVIRDVRAATGDQQTPQLLSTMSIEFYFHTDRPRVGQAVVLDEPEPQPEVVADVTPEPTLTVMVPAATVTPEPEPVPVAPSTRSTAAPPPDLPLELQRRLQLAGCDVGFVDGRWGPRSRRALIAYAEAVGIDGGQGEPDAAFLGTMEALVVGACADVLGPRQPIDPRGLVFEGAWTEEQTTRNSRGVSSTHVTRHTYILDVAADGSIADTFIAGINQPRTRRFDGALGGSWTDTTGDRYSWYVDDGRLVREIERGTYTSRAYFTVARTERGLVCTLEVVLELKPGETRVMSRTQAGNSLIEVTGRRRIETTCSVN